MASHNGRQHVTIHLRPDEFEASMRRAERKAEGLAIRTTHYRTAVRNVVAIAGMIFSAALTGLLSLHQFGLIFR